MADETQEQFAKRTARKHFPGMGWHYTTFDPVENINGPFTYSAGETSEGAIMLCVSRYLRTVGFPENTTQDLYQEAYKYEDDQVGWASDTKLEANFADQLDPKIPFEERWIFHALLYDLGDVNYHSFNSRLREFFDEHFVLPERVLCTS